MLTTYNYLTEQQQQQQPQQRLEEQDHNLYSRCKTGSVIAGGRSLKSSSQFCGIREAEGRYFSHGDLLAIQRQEGQYQEQQGQQQRHHQQQQQQPQRLKEQHQYSTIRSRHPSLNCQQCHAESLHNRQQNQQQQQLRVQQPQQQRYIHRSPDSIHQHQQQDIQQHPVNAHEKHQQNIQHPVDVEHQQQSQQPYHQHYPSEIITVNGQR